MEAAVGTEDFGGASRERREAVAAAAAWRLGTALARREVFVPALLVLVEVEAKVEEVLGYRVLPYTVDGPYVWLVAPCACCVERAPWAEVCAFCPPPPGR